MALLEYIAATDAPFKVAVLVEPYMNNPGGLGRVQRGNILSILREEVYNVYPDQMFQWERNPLLVTWCEVDLAVPNQARFTIERWCSTKDPEWRDNPGLDWNWYPDPAVLNRMLSNDGVFVVYPRFDEYWMFIMGKDMDRPYRRLDPLLTESVYERTWQAAVESKDSIRMIIVYSWNEHEEHAAIELDQGRTRLSYGRSLVEKTAQYYRQFRAAEAIIPDARLPRAQVGPIS